jgi:hypothetical protein
LGEGEEPIADCNQRQDEHSTAKANAFGGGAAEDCCGSARSLGEGQGGATKVTVSFPHLCGAKH